MTEDVKSEGHTPTPWRVKKHGSRYRIVDAAQQMTIAHVQIEYMNAASGNAELIVTAVNERSALLKCEEALRKLADHLDARIDDAPGTAKPVFNGLAEVRAALTLLDEARHGK